MNPVNVDLGIPTELENTAVGVVNLLFIKQILRSAGSGKEAEEHTAVFSFPMLWSKQH